MLRSRANHGLLCSRLNLSATSTDSSTPKKGRGTKRKRVTLDVAEETGSGYDFASEASAKGAIEIHDTDHDGKFIKLFNTGEEVGCFKYWHSLIVRT